MFDKRISITTLGVKDLVASTQFYERLGWEKASASTDTITFIKLRGIVLGLFPLEELAKDAGVENDKARFSGTTMAHNLDSKEAVDKAMAFAISCGATEIKAPEEVFWGGYSGYFADPDGYLWELAFITHLLHSTQRGIWFFKANYLMCSF